MERRFELVENERAGFSAPIELRWTGPDGSAHSAAGHSIDASAYGLGVLVGKQLPRDTEVTVWIGDTVLCGLGSVRYSNAVGDGFRTGLQFQTTLVMQGIAELDSILMKRLKPRSKETLFPFAPLRVFLRSLAARA